MSNTISNQHNLTQQHSEESYEIHPNDIPSGSNLLLDHGIVIVCGFAAAAVFSHILYWLRYNSQHNPNSEINGKIWMYETQKSMSDFLIAMSEDEVYKAIKILVSHGLIIKGNFNKNKFDRTSWYTVYDQNLITNDRQKKLKKCLRNRETPESISPPVGFSYIEKNKNNNKTTTAYVDSTDKGPAVAAVSSDLSNNFNKELDQAKKNLCQTFQPNTDLERKLEKRPNPNPSPPKCKAKIYQCLENVEIPVQDKLEITRTYNEATVIRAVEFVNQPGFKIRTTLQQAIKWACKNNPSVPQDKGDMASSNKAWSQKLVNCLPKNVKSIFQSIDVLSKNLEFVRYGAGSNLCTVFDYSLANFKTQVEKFLSSFGVKYDFAS